MTGADLSYARLNAAVLRHANLDRARFCRANLRREMGQHTTVTDLTEASLKEADLSYTDLTGAILHKAIFARSRPNRNNLNRCGFEGGSNARWYGARVEAALFSL